MRSVEAPSGAGAEDMAFEKDDGPSVRQKTAPGRLDHHHRPQHGGFNADMLCRGGQTVTA
jgi:hypothetical protein